jgi:hypothetical protein
LEWASKRQIEGPNAHRFEEARAVDGRLLNKLFGGEQRWHGPCTIVLDSEAGIQTIGADSIGASATKSYAPRLVSGRVCADGVCLLADGSALLIVQLQKLRQVSGEEITRQALLIVDPHHVVGVEFFDYSALAALGMHPPPSRSNSHPGTTLRPV